MYACCTVLYQMGTTAVCTPSCPALIAPRRSKTGALIRLIHSQSQLESCLTSRFMTHTQLLRCRPHRNPNAYVYVPYTSSTCGRSILRATASCEPCSWSYHSMRDLKSGLLSEVRRAMELHGMRKLVNPNAVVTALVF